MFILGRFSPGHAHRVLARRLQGRLIRRRPKRLRVLRRRRHVVCLRRRRQYGDACKHRVMTERQRVQNCLARVVTRSPRFSRSVPLLKSLHWLPVQYCIIFKICTIAYQALSSIQPVITLFTFLG